MKTSTLTAVSAGLTFFYLLLAIFVSPAIWVLPCWISFSITIMNLFSAWRLYPERSYLGCLARCGLMPFSVKSDYAKYEVKKAVLLDEVAFLANEAEFRFSLDDLNNLSNDSLDAVKQQLITHLCNIGKELPASFLEQNNGNDKR